jgi:hypothetical protein
MASGPSPSRQAPPQPQQYQRQPQSSTHRTTPGQRFDQPGPRGHRGLTQLGDYKVIKTLGEGSFGKVRRNYPNHFNL